MIYKGPFNVRSARKISTKRMAAISNSLAKGVGREVVLHCGKFMLKGMIEKVGSDFVRLINPSESEQGHVQGILGGHRIVWRPMGSVAIPITIAIRTIRPKNSYYL